MHTRERIPDHNVEVFRFRKNVRADVVASIGSYAGTRIVDIREFSGAYAGKGLTIRAEQLPELERAISALRAAVDAQSAPGAVARDD